MADTERKTVYLGKSTAKQMQSGAAKWLNISVHKDEINAHANEKGYVNLSIFERKTPGQFGDTHSITVRQTLSAQADDAEAAEEAAE